MREPNILAAAGNVAIRAFIHSYIYYILPPPDGVHRVFVFKTNTDQREKERNKIFELSSP